MSRYEYHRSKLVAQIRHQVCSNIQSCVEHKDLVHVIARAFSDQSIVEETGYVFQLLEPLESLGSTHQGAKTFDLAIVNLAEKSLLMVEVKTTSSEHVGSDLLRDDLAPKIEFLKENFDFLLEQMNMKGQINWQDVEFVYCLEEGMGLKGFKKSLSNCFTDNKGKQNLAVDIGIAGRTIIWEMYWANEADDRVIKIDDELTKHGSDALNKMLLRGIEQRKLKNNIAIPFLLTDHPWLILQHTISHSLIKNSNRTEIGDKKVLQIQDMIKYASEVASAGAVVIDEWTAKRAKEVVENAISHGITYDLLKEVEGGFRIRCRGDLENTIIQNLGEKYRGTDFEKNAGTYAMKNAHQTAMEMALKDFEEMFPNTLDLFMKIE